MVNKKGVEGPRKPRGGGRACRAESVGGARGSPERCRRALRGPQPPRSLSSLLFSPHSFGPRPVLLCITSTYSAKLSSTTKTSHKYE
uniref:Advanced glycosylation end-product specific receptor n=1 Tax=Molossus molossus TaxID=27622 RepID=A0A7J8GP63_MOLMO|nr:advanced glycosylation end-product specific receptor [Molossus molossus]